MSSSYRPKLAAVVTTYFKYSHAQHIVDRFLDGYGWNGAHHYPPMDLVSLYVDQVGQNDLSRERANRHPTMKTCPSIAEALTLGGSKLAVDGVVLVAEHGNYPRNEKGQTQYPRHEFFEEIVKVFRATGHSVPVFNDKHLSWNWEWARQMFDTSRELGFAFMAGSSLPVTWRTPSVEMPLGSRVGEALCVCYGGVDSYDFHGLETIQCMVERVPHEAAHVVIGGEDVAVALASWRERVAPGQRRLHQRPGPDAFAQRVPKLVSAICLHPLDAGLAAAPPFDHALDGLQTVKVIAVHAAVADAQGFADARSERHLD